MTLDELHRTLTTYEMRIDIENGKKNRKETFKATKKTRNKEHRVEEIPSDESNEEESYFVRRLKRRAAK
jgi:hypothetical protein